VSTELPSNSNSSGGGGGGRQHDAVYVDVGVMDGRLVGGTSSDGIACERGSSQDRQLPTVCSNERPQEGNSMTNAASASAITIN